MPEILAIKNLTVSHSFLGAGATAVPGIFTQSVTSMPVHPVDEVVIRSISWNGSADLGGNMYLYLIWSNITNDVIGSFAGGNYITNCPGTRILLNAPFPNLLEFRLLRARTTDNEPPMFEPAVIGDLAICMDMISYRRHNNH